MNESLTKNISKQFDDVFVAEVDEGRIDLLDALHLREDSIKNQSVLDEINSLNSQSNNAVPFDELIDMRLVDGWVDAMEPRFDWSEGATLGYNAPQQTKRICTLDAGGFRYMFILMYQTFSIANKTPNRFDNEDAPAEYGVEIGKAWITICREEA